MVLIALDLKPKRKDWAEEASQLIGRLTLEWTRRSGAGGVRKGWIVDVRRTARGRNGNWRGGNGGGGGCWNRNGEGHCLMRTVEGRGRDPEVMRRRRKEIWRWPHEGLDPALSSVSDKGWQRTNDLDGGQRRSIPLEGKAQRPDEDPHRPEGQTMAYVPQGRKPLRSTLGGEAENSERTRDVSVGPQYISSKGSVAIMKPKLLAGFHFKKNGSAVKAFVKKSFVRRHVHQLGVTKKKTIVHISDVTYKKMMVGQDFLEVVVPDLFTD
eukprot:s1543_g36.t1